MENLSKCKIILVSWCSMCKRAKETVKHLLMHFTMARELWDMVFTLFGIQWVMPGRLIDLLDCWQCRFEHHQCIEIWKAITHYLMWCI